MTTRTFVLGTRGSRLALAQSTTVARAIEEAGARLGEDVRVNLEVVRTHGDVSAAPLAALGGVGVFAAQLRLALLGGECDLAVHSFKDLPTAPTPGLRIAAVPQREDPRDALCAADGETLSSLPAGALVGTGSPRRAAQVLAARPDLRVCDLRGNVPTTLITRASSRRAEEASSTRANAPTGAAHPAPRAERTSRSALAASAVGRW